MVSQDFYNKMTLQMENNLAKYGKQDITKICLVCQEELGEVIHEKLSGDMAKMRIEIIHLAALLPILYDETLKQ